ncbi:MAG: glycogen synthase [Bacillota bacterium]
MKIMFIGSEATPYAKTGGLADVLGSLPNALKEKGHEVSLVLPAHKKIKDNYQDRFVHVKDFTITLHTKEEYVGIEHIDIDGMNVFFIDNDYYFGKRETLYGHYDDGERYGFFNQAVLTMFKEIDYFPDVLHLNDWQTGLIPFYLKHTYKDWKYTSIKTVFTIHNIAYQGVFSKGLLPYLNLTEHHDLEYDGHINFLKTALVTTDKITTVSKTYAEELKYDYFSFGMGPIIREREADMVGIMNGLDNDVFDPRKDQSIAKNFGLNNYLIGKRENRQAVLDMFNLNDKKVPIIGMVSRLTEAKGFPIVQGMIEYFLDQKACQFILLGSGDTDIEAYFHHLKHKYPEYVGVYFGYNDAIARQIYAGVNFFLMPSRFEPCGLAQLISMRYGTLPIVRETGGLKDSVLPYNKYTHDGTGFSFSDYSEESLAHVLNEALTMYKDTKVYKQLVRRVMKEDFSWEKSATQYHLLYKSLMEAK